LKTPTSLLQFFLRGRLLSLTLANYTVFGSLIKVIYIILFRSSSQTGGTILPVAEIRSIQNQFQTTQLPILNVLAGPNAGAYSNEADVLEPDFQHTFFGPNYAKLSAIKWRYGVKTRF
jgi:hypothetical protein